MMKRKLILTKDGSHSYYSSEFGEAYHSIYGAIQESRHIFIESGLKLIDKKTIRIFEMGFGSGLNCLLSWAHAQSENQFIKYDSIELYPIDLDEASEFNYPELLGIPREEFENLHSCPWGERIDLGPNFRIFKIRGDMKSFAPEGPYDLIYFDAFSPDAQADLWKTEIFNKLYKALVPGGILTSYCARGDFKRALREVGFEVERIPGPPGKRHILRAIK